MEKENNLGAAFPPPYTIKSHQLNNCYYRDNWGATGRDDTIMVIRYF